MSADRPSSTEDEAKASEPAPSETKSKSKSKARAKAKNASEPETSSPKADEPAAEAGAAAEAAPAEAEVASASDESLDDSLDAIISEAKGEAAPPAEAAAAEDEETPLPVTIDEDLVASAPAATGEAKEAAPAAPAAEAASEAAAAAPPPTAEIEKATEGETAPTASASPAGDGAPGAVPATAASTAESAESVELDSIVESMDAPSADAAAAPAQAHAAAELAVPVLEPLSDEDTTSSALDPSITARRGTHAAAGSVEAPATPPAPATDEELLDKIVLPPGSTPVPQPAVTATYRSATLAGLSDEDSTVISPMPPLVEIGDQPRRHDTPRRTVTQSYAPLTGLAAMVAATAQKPAAGTGPLRKASEKLRKMADTRVDWSVGQLAVVVVASGLLGGVAVLVTQKNPNIEVVSGSASAARPARPDIEAAQRPSIIKPRIDPLPPLHPQPGATATTAGSEGEATAATVATERPARPRRVARRAPPAPPAGSAAGGIDPFAGPAPATTAAAPVAAPSREATAAAVRPAAAAQARKAPAASSKRKVAQTEWKDPFGQ